MYRKTLIVLALLLCCCLTALAFSRAPKKEVKEVQKSIDFTLKDITGQSHALSQYAGKVVVLNFWATWCPPCRAEMPSMQKLYDSWDENKYVMLAVNIGQDKDTVVNFALENAYTFPILLDNDSSVSKLYKVSGIPSTFIIGLDGNIAGKVVGAREWKLSDVKKFLK